MYEVAINEFMYPDDILEFLDVLLLNREYEKVIKTLNDNNISYSLEDEFDNEEKLIIIRK